MERSDGVIAIVGASGQLGSWIGEQLGDRAWPLDLPELDITDRDATLRLLLCGRPTAIINCAAFTAVDRAEREPDTCFAVNATAVEHLVEAANVLDCAFVQVSTDYVFGVAPFEPRPWRETDVPTPVGIYAASKYAGELAAMQARRHLIVRTCGLYGHATRSAESRNFVEAILAKAERGEPLRVVDDQRCSPSYARDVAAAVIRLLDLNQRGFFHVTNAGETSWFEFAQTILELTAYQCSLTAISTAEYDAAAPRPAYSVLDGSKYEQAAGRPMRGLREALADYLRRRGILTVDKRGEDGSIGPV
jgi:dTDP-4-dehydrorhamnose reductase